MKETNYKKIIKGLLKGEMVIIDLGGIEIFLVPDIDGDKVCIEFKQVSVCPHAEPKVTNLMIADFYSKKNKKEIIEDVEEYVERLKLEYCTTKQNFISSYRRLKMLKGKKTRQIVKSAVKKDN